MVLDLIPPYSVILNVKRVKIPHEAPSIIHGLGNVLEVIPQMLTLTFLVHSICHAKVKGFFGTELCHLTTDQLI